MDANKGDCAMHPTLSPHFTATDLLLTTNVVVASVSLLMTVCAFTVIAVNITAIASANPAMRGKRCERVIFISFTVCLEARTQAESHFTPETLFLAGSVGRSENLSKRDRPMGDRSKL
jgi:hypothetical protein